MIVGLVLAVATALVIWGGVHRIGFITSVIVPVMAVAYILMGIVTIAMHVTEIPHVFGMIMQKPLISGRGPGGRRKCSGYRY